MRELSALPAQASAYFIHTAAGDPQIQNTQLSLSLGETCSAEALRVAWQKAAAAHAMLRSAFRKAPTGELLRRELDGAEASWRTLDWSSVPPAELSAQWAKAQAEDATQAIDLATAPLVRFLAITLPGGHCHLLATFPKLLLDEDSLFHLICEWLEALEGRPLPATPLEEGEPTSSATPAVADWWGQFFNNAPEPVRVQVLPAPAEQTLTARHHVPFLMDRETSKRINTLAQKLSISSGDIFLAAWSFAIARLSSRNRVVMLAPARCAEPGPAECGLHDNLLPFQAAINGGQSAEAFLKEIARGEKDRSNHSSIPLERVLLLSQPQRRLRDFSTAFRWLPPSINDRVHDVFPRWINLDAQLHQQSFFPLTFEVRDGSRFALDLQYSDALPRGEAEQLLARIRGVLDFFLETPNKRLSEIRLLDNEQWQLFKDSETPRKAEPALSIEKQIAEAVILHAETLAVEGPSDGALTYGELDSHATSLAAWLRHENLAEGWTVGVCLTPTPWLPVAVLGILRAGDTCLPLDPGADRAWLLQKAEGCDAELILCDSYTAQFFEGKRVLVLDQQWDTVSAIPATAAASEIKPPKASFFVTTAEPTDSSSVIALSPETTAETCRQFAELLSLEEGHRVPLVAAAGTGAFVETLLGTLASGATLVLLPPGDDIPGNVSHLRLTAAQWRTWVAKLPKLARENMAAPDVLESPEGIEATPVSEPHNLFENLHTICVEAALLPPTLHAEWQRLNEGQTRWIQYASPAGLCGQSVRFVQMENARSLPDPAEVPLGAPGPGVRAELHDFAGHPLPARYEGVLQISVDGRSQSLPAWRDAGGLFHLAPTAESLLEKALSEAPGVLDVHTGRVDVNGHPALGAWIVFEEGTDALPGDFAAQIHRRFPEMEYPAFIRTVPEFPLDRFGAIDLAALPKPAPAPAPSPSQPAAAPVARAVPEAPVQEWQPLLLLQKTADAPTLFLVHDIDGNPDKVKTLGDLLAGEWNIYATSARGLRHPSACHNSIEAEAASLVEALCLLDPEGPYHLFGWDFGAVLAMVMARQLRVAGRQVPYLALAGAKAPQMPEATGGWKKSLTKLFQGGKPAPVAIAHTPVAQAHARALQEYRARPLSGPAGIILGADQAKDEAAWLELVPEATTEKMSCQSRDMLTEPAVKRLAVILREWSAGEDEEEEAAE